MIKKMFMVLIICLSCSTASATIVGITEEFEINFIPFDELFAPEYQPRYIINGHINVGPYSYDVFVNRTMIERQQIYQVCKKHLSFPWKYDDAQERWERCLYMYQFVVKPYPFPFPEYQPIPEPATAIILGVGCLSFLMKGRK